MSAMAEREEVKAELRELQQFLRFIGCAFFDKDLQLCLLEALSRTDKPVLDRHLAERLKLSITDVNRGMAALKKDLFVVQHERKVKKCTVADDGTRIERPEDIPKTFTYYAVDYRLLLDIVKYKVTVLSNASEIDGVSSNQTGTYFCPRCICAVRVKPDWDHTSIPADPKLNRDYNRYCQTCLLEISQCPAEAGNIIGTRHEGVDDPSVLSLASASNDMKLLVRNVVIYLFRHSRDLVKQCRHDENDDKLVLGVHRDLILDQVEEIISGDYDTKSLTPPTITRPQLVSLIGYGLKQLKPVAKGGELEDKEMYAMLQKGMNDQEVKEKREATSLLIDGFSTFIGPPCKKYKAVDILELFDEAAGCELCKICQSPLASVKPLEEEVRNRSELVRVLDRVRERLRILDGKIIPYQYWGMGIEAAVSKEFRALKKNLGLDGPVEQGEGDVEDEEGAKEQNEEEIVVTIDRSSKPNEYSIVEHDEEDDAEVGMKRKGPSRAYRKGGAYSLYGRSGSVKKQKREEGDESMVTEEGDEHDERWGTGGGGEERMVVSEGRGGEGSAHAFGGGVKQEEVKEEEEEARLEEQAEKIMHGGNDDDDDDDDEWEDEL